MEGSGDNDPSQTAGQQQPVAGGLPYQHHQQPQQILNQPGMSGYSHVIPPGQQAWPVVVSSSPAPYVQGMPHVQMRPVQPVGPQPGRPLQQNPMITNPGNINGHPLPVQGAVDAAKVPPLPKSHVKLPSPITVGNAQNQNSTTLVDVIYYQFFQSHPDMWVKFNVDYQRYCKEIFQTYLLWGKMIKERGEMVKEQRKRLRESETVRERLKRKIREQYVDAEKVVRRDWPSIHEPKTDDEKKFLPSSRASHLVQRCCGPDVTLTEQAQTALELLAKNFVEDAVSFGVAMARRRPKNGQAEAQEIQSNDIALFLRTAWNIMMPTSDGVVKGYTCNVPKASYKSIEAAARKENLLEGRPLFNEVQAQEAGQKK